MKDYKSREFYKKRARFFGISLLIVLSSLILAEILLFSFPTVSTQVSKVSYPFSLKTSEWNFEGISNRWESNSLILDLANICSYYPNDQDKIGCVYNQINLIYNYEDRGTLNSIGIPEEILIEGGVCRHYTVLAHSVLNVLGLNPKFTFKPEHVYLEIDLEDQKCILDNAQARFFCGGYDE